jgi:uncharacterized protein with PIN domain
VKFVCDNTVGKLARLLRMAGLDTAYVPEDDLRRVISLSREQGRKIVSRNSRFAELTIASDVYHLTADGPEEQFIQLAVDLQLELDSDKYLTRCVDCNDELVPIDKNDIRGRVWPYVWQTQHNFSTCPSCGRIYWRATHAEAIAIRLERLRNEVTRREKEGL